MRFGVSVHAAHAWTWYEPSQDFDGNLTKADGKGKWWEGLDPQELYTGPNIKMPDGVTGAKAVAAWHEKNDRPWTEEPPAMNPKFTESWFLRCKDLVDKYHPDLVYFDNIGNLPLGQAGLDVVAHYYNANLKWTGGKIESVVNCKGLSKERRSAVVDDIERGVATDILPEPWQTDTCIGEWHYSRNVAEKNRYKTVDQVVDMLVDIVSKNGNLLLSIPVRGDGTIDDQEVAFLEGMAKWMSVNGEAIFGTRPWKVFGEGPTKARAGMFGESRYKFTAEDVRFTTKGDTLYAVLLGWPGEKDAVIKTLATNSPYIDGKKVTDVSLLGYKGRLEWSQDEQGLTVKMPGKQPSEHAVALKIKGITAD
jgi:alpha-L-fucosidase